MASSLRDSIGSEIAANPTLKRGANNHCAYGAVAPALRKVARKMRETAKNMNPRVACLIICALFAAGVATTQSPVTKPTAERTIFGDAESFKNTVPLPRNVLDLLIEPFKDDEHYRGFVVGKSDKDLNRLFFAVVVQLSGPNQVDYIIEGNLPFAGADNTWFWVVRSAGDHPRIILNEGSSWIELLNSRTNGYRDIRSVWVMSGTTRTRVFHYDGASYKLFNETEKQKP